MSFHVLQDSISGSDEDGLSPTSVDVPEATQVLHAAIEFIS